MIETAISQKQHFLIDKWNLYYHLPYDKSWDKTSYKIIMNDINTVEKVIGVTEILPEEVIKNCMLFMMRDGILPLWEDVNNRNGGAFSFKILNKSVSLVWKNLVYVLCGETLTRNKIHMNLINGISISPKKSFCIVKIWLKDCSIQEPDILIDIKDLSKVGCLFKKHEPEF